MFGDGDVITRNEVVTVEFEPRFIVIRTLCIVIEGPAADRATHQVSQFVPLTRPEALYATPLAHPPPFVGEEMAIFGREALQTRNRDPCCLRETRGCGRAPVEYVSWTWRVISSRPSLVAATRSCSDAVCARRVGHWLAKVDCCRDRHGRAATHRRLAIVLDEGGFCFGSAPHGIGELRRSFTPLIAPHQPKVSWLARHGQALGFLPRPF